MPEYVALPSSTTPTECGEESSTDGGDETDGENTLHLLFQNRNRMSEDFVKQVCDIRDHHANLGLLTYHSHLQCHLRGMDLCFLCRVNL